MQAFVTVVEEGSFTAAALQFDISPTAMSKKVSMLEKSLNTRLLIRTPRLITMTDIGKKYYAQCEKVLHEYKLSNLLIEDKNSNLSGTLNIVCMREVAQRLVYPTMATFLEQYQHIVTNVTLKKQSTDIVSKNFDIAIGYELSEIFNDWCCRKLDKLLLYYPNIKPTPLKIKVYIDYLAQSWKDRAVALKT
ncbi:MAG: LysR family transcriptional regulator [Gammaproteobacteria bacterium]|nr:LysR family transcriptional regulator [Gammaproteobacteria bacterium]